MQYSIGIPANIEIAGSLHVFFEGYFVYNHSRMSSMQDFLGQLWKEYALSDSRYMSSDPIVLCMESLTTVRRSMRQFFQNMNLNCTDWLVQITWGPLCFLTAVLITRNSPYRHPVQALVSTGHLYGNLIYYTTCLFEDFYSAKRYYRPEPQYFWVYFILMNAFWLIIPASESSHGLCWMGSDWCAIQYVYTAVSRLREGRL